MGRSLNEVRLIGNLGADPELRYTAGGKAVCELSVATSYSNKDASGNRVDKTEWHKVVLWDRRAEVAAEYARKGRQVYIAGRLETDKWTDKDGIDRYTTKVIATDFFLTGGNPNAGQASGGGRAAPQGKQEPAGAVFDGEDEIPF